MLAIIIAWIVISLVLLSFGDIFITLYNKLSKKEERYNLPETFMLGMAFVSLLLSAISFALPLNYYILLALIAICILYWCRRIERIGNMIKAIRQGIEVYSKSQLIAIALLFLFFLVFIIWCMPSYDASFYHHQNIRWNEDYAIVPGLGNLESRLGFNSNYFLLSAVFSFRFLFGEAIYGGLQSVLLLFVLFWCLRECVMSNYDIKSILLLVFFFLFFLSCRDMLSESSTDIVPHICIFYFICKFALCPETFKAKSLFVCILPVVLLTFKLSTAPCLLFSLIALYYLIKEKKSRSIISLIVFGISIIGLWLARNVIVSGYLIYPLHEIDIFSFDWKMPLDVAIADRDYIHSYAKNSFYNVFSLSDSYLSTLLQYNKRAFLLHYLTIALTVFLFAIPFIIIYYIIRKKKISHIHYLLLGVTAIYILYWLISAPDIRFVLGVFYGVIFLATIIITNQYPQKQLYSCCRKFIFPVFVLGIICSTASIPYYAIRKIISFPPDTSRHLLQNVLYMPYSAKMEAQEKNSGLDFEAYDMGNGITIYITTDSLGRSFDIIPATAPYNIKGILKYQDIRTVEPRGTSLQDGFRTRKECLDKINEEAEEKLELKYKLY
ncbi:hypothetical protein [Dysgonomonas sp. 511]|uniref:LIC_10190 family membrane protein n=1 Tax=Dysgonomonas sp. 511 TaxID=2302930 RepID=UPI0013D48233|nr:hypothetical protein [Dysgonomonas sp. 511]NDV78193.1 hypothetical protein [Dysgonomonas sp. 511]